MNGNLIGLALDRYLPSEACTPLIHWDNFSYPSDTIKEWKVNGTWIDVDTCDSLYWCIDRSEGVLKVDIGRIAHNTVTEAQATIYNDLNNYDPNDQYYVPLLTNGMNTAGFILLSEVIVDIPDGRKVEVLKSLQISIIDEISNELSCDYSDFNINIPSTVPITHFIIGMIYDESELGYRCFIYPAWINMDWFQGIDFGSLVNISDSVIDIISLWSSSFTLKFSVRRTNDMISEDSVIKIDNVRIHALCR